MKFKEIIEYFSGIIILCYFVGKGMNYVCYYMLVYVIGLFLWVLLIIVIGNRGGG